MSDDDLVEIRTFASMEEIRALPGFQEDNPINSENYRSIIGDYWFPDEVRCCREVAPSQLCGEGHKWGFVARRMDNTITLVGNCCARDKFGASSKIKADRAKYLNEKRRRERFSALADLLVEEHSMTSKLQGFEERLRNIQERVNIFLGSLGDRTSRQLQSMSRSENMAVMVRAVSYRDYVDEGGQKRRERSTSPKKLGALQGLSVVSDSSFQPLYSLIRTSRKALLNAKRVTDTIKTTELDALISSIDVGQRLELDVSKLEQEAARFFDNDFSLLCFLVDDRPERYRAARVYLERSGEPAGKERAKAWLLEREQAIKKEINADKIEIS